MSEISVVDTGYPNIANTGTQLATSSRANSGNVITLKTAEIDYQRGTGFDNTPVPTKFSDVEVNFASTENPKGMITGVLKRDVTADMDLIAELDKLATTKGIKLLYYSSTTDGYRELTDSLGTGNSNDVHKTANFSSVATPHFHVRFTSFSIKQVPSGKLLRYQLSYEVTT